MSRNSKKTVTFLLIVVLTFSQFVCMLPQKVYAKQTKEILSVHVDGREFDVRALNQDYDNNIYISMNDMSVAMANTDKAFELEWSQEDGNSVAVLTKVAKSEGDAETSDDKTADEDDDASKDEEDNTANYSRKRLKIHIENTEYYLYVIPVNEKDEKDCYVNLGEFAMAMNIDVETAENDGNNRISSNSGSMEEVYINSKNEFDFGKYDLENSGIAYMADSILVGDATTGEIFYSSNADETVAIASTSKLMTYLLIKEAMSEGKISNSDTVSFSQKASDLSNTSDGVIHVSAGQTADIEDVIKGMLIVSSNECALALAEHLCGNEQDFVELMNRKVKALGMSETAQFYNPHGLPMFVDDVLNIKQSNHLTANDMFILSSYILDKYPEITEITSIKKTYLESLGNYTATNTNALLYNVPGTVGLKTGTTDKAASCLVSTYEIADGAGEPHYITCIVYGAENSQAQGYVSMIMLNYGISKFKETRLGILPAKEGPVQVPENFEELSAAVLGAARRNANY